MLSFYHTYHCKHIIAESLSLGRSNWSLQTRILLSDKEVIKELVKEYKLPYCNNTIDSVDRIYNRIYLTPDHEKYNSINESMCLAAKFGNIEIVDKMVALGADYYDWAIISAANNGHIGIVDKLLALGATNYNSTMATAAENGHMEIIDKMLALGADAYGWAMSSAAKNGHIKIIDKMIALGANNYNQSMTAAALNGHIEIIDKMLALGATNYNLSMYFAVKYGHIKIVSRLLPLCMATDDFRLKKNINLALECRHLDIVELLETEL